MFDLRSAVKQGYIEVTERIFGEEQARYPLNKREENALDKFEKLINKHYEKSSFGPNALSRYFMFQYDYWLELETRVHKGRIPLDWIVGKKAIERWINFPYRDLTKARNTTSKYQITENLFKPRRKVDVADLKPHEEIEKARHHNQDGGLVNCIEFTTLFNQQSPWCETCNKSDECKLVLQTTYPKIFLKRGLIPERRKTRRVK